MTRMLPCLLSIALLTMPVFASSRQLPPVRDSERRSVANDNAGSRIIGERRQPKYGKEWQKATPEECGFNPSTLAEIPKLIKARNMGTTGLMIVVGGKEIDTKRMILSK